MTENNYKMLYAEDANLVSKYIKTFSKYTSTVEKNNNKENVIKDVSKISVPLIYLGGGIMTRGENLARAEEYEKIKQANLEAEVYSPIRNEGINNKSAMTEEENNVLAEKIVAEDIDRLWRSDCTVMCPEQSAIGTMCEVSVLYGWKYMSAKILELVKMLQNALDATRPAHIKDGWYKSKNPTAEDKALMFDAIMDLVKRQDSKKNYAHYFDIRTNHLNEKDWRRSFSINQMLLGIILAATEDNTLHNSFDELIPILENLYGERENG